MHVLAQSTHPGLPLVQFLMKALPVPLGWAILANRPTLLYQTLCIHIHIHGHRSWWPVLDDIFLCPCVRARKSAGSFDRMMGINTWLGVVYLLDTSAFLPNHYSCHNTQSSLLVCPGPQNRPPAVYQAICSFVYLGPPVVHQAIVLLACPGPPAVHQAILLLAYSGPPVVHRGHRLVDAAVFEPVPVRAALADGCTHVLVLATRPAVQHTTLQKYVRGTVVWAVKKTVLNAPYMSEAWASDLAEEGEGGNGRGGVREGMTRMRTWARAYYAGMEDRACSPLLVMCFPCNLFTLFLVKQTRPHSVASHPLLSVSVSLTALVDRLPLMFANLLYQTQSIVSEGSIPGLAMHSFPCT
eukprot:1094279-Pelagomonas_calceolata.AAC.1